MTAGVGQFVLINFGLLNQLYGVNDGWNMTLIITDPDGITSKIDLMTWSTGSAGYGYTPTKVGDYKVQSSFERAEYNGVWYAVTGINVINGTLTQKDGKIETSALITEETEVLLNINTLKDVEIAKKIMNTTTH